MPEKIIKIAITGPESTGKSTLAKELAKYYQTIYVPEYARTYMDQLNRPYTLEDIIQIAQGQLASEVEKLKQAQKILFSDTESLVTKIWSAHAYQTCPTWIEEQWQKQIYDLYLLMNIDLPWQADEQREHPHLRDFFFQWYKKNLEEAARPFVIISGLGEERLQQAIQEIDKILKNASVN